MTPTSLGRPARWLARVTAAQRVRLPTSRYSPTTTLRRGPAWAARQIRPRGTTTTRRGQARPQLRRRLKAASGARSVGSATRRWRPSRRLPPPAGRSACNSPTTSRKSLATNPRARRGCEKNSRRGYWPTTTTATTTTTRRRRTTRPPGGGARARTGGDACARGAMRLAANTALGAAGAARADRARRRRTRSAALVGGLAGWRAGATTPRR